MSKKDGRDEHDHFHSPILMGYSESYVKRRRLMFEQYAERRYAS